MRLLNKRGRLVKELLESLPVIHCVLEHVEQLRPKLTTTGEKLTVLDLCSGFGYLVMFLSELLQSSANRQDEDGVPPAVVVHRHPGGAWANPAKGAFALWFTSQSMAY